MNKLKLSGKELMKLGFPDHKSAALAMNVMLRHYKRSSHQDVMKLLNEIVSQPEKFKSHETLGKIAILILGEEDEKPREYKLEVESRPFKVYGKADIGLSALDQMYVAMKLPISVSGALMPDAHEGYGLPIGAVLATRNEVIPYGVGVDIGCRMCLSIFPLEASYMDQRVPTFKAMLEDHTRFGGDYFNKRNDHEILERKEFQELSSIKGLKDKAWKQLGSSGSGNHFVEWGVVDVLDHNPWQLKPGAYLGLLSHSGSRALGAHIARFYTKVARQQCRLPSEANSLAWLSLDSTAGAEYWTAMNLAGDYATACHQVIHHRLAKALGERVLARIENHHNFAWKEVDAEGNPWIVHRKGATPAGKGVLGIIPGSMTTAGYIIRGKGVDTSLSSASHGAGRLYSRSKARSSITHKMLRQELKQAGVTLLGGGLDEAPMAYKDIQTVMGHQEDLVEVLGTFMPRIVKMCGDQSPAED